MKKLLLIFLALSFLSLPALPSRPSKDSSADREVVFDNSSSEVPYRIPAIAATPSGDIIAVADYRYSKADIGMVKNGRLDLRYRIKDAETGLWSDVLTLAAAHGEDDDNVAYGDPCIVADSESPLVMVTSCSGNVSFPKGTPANHQGWVKFISPDGGKTWSGPIDLTPQADSILNSRVDGPVNAYFIGSGKIEQSSRIKNGEYYRIYCSPLVRTAEGKTKVNYVFYSDDFGDTWHLLGDIDNPPVPSGADEAKVEELPDGSVLISSRVKNGRLFNVFSYSDPISGAGEWQSAVLSSQDNNGLFASSNACNGETLCIPVIRTSDGAPVYLLLQSVPMNGEGKRAEVGINYKELGNPADGYTSESIASDWTGRFIVTPESSAYSTMTPDKDGNIAFLFEENEKNGGYDIILRTLSISEITSGRYR